MIKLLILQHDTYHPLLLFIPKSLPYKLPLTPCCAVCGLKTDKSQGEKKPSLATCSRCHAVAYCGSDHQKEDFENHKKLCRHVQATWTRHQG